MKRYAGGCHCGRVRFAVDAPEVLSVLACNCSMCRRVGGYHHLIVPRERFHLESGERDLTTYTFGTGVARHRFCRVCGIKSFYVPRSHPDCISVSALCLDPEGVGEVRVEPFDGADWEAAVHAIRDA